MTSGPIDVGSTARRFKKTRRKIGQVPESGPEIQDAPPAFLRATARARGADAARRG